MSRIRQLVEKERGIRLASTTSEVEFMCSLVTELGMKVNRPCRGIRLASTFYNI